MVVLLTTSPLWLISVLVIALQSANIVFGRNQVLKTSSNTYILRTFDGKASIIADDTMLKSLEYMGEVESITDADLSLLVPGEAVQNIDFHNGITADDTIEVMLAHIRTLQPTKHYHINSFYFPNFMTPSIVPVDDMVLVIFRPFLDNAKILLGWMFNDTTFTFHDEPVSFYNITYPWTTFGYSEVQNDPKALLVRSATMKHKYPHRVGAHHTEGHEVYLSYSSGPTPKACVNHYVRIFIPSAAAMQNAAQNKFIPPPQVVFTKPNRLYYTEGGNWQKNWVAFEYKTKLLLLERINPMHVMELVADGEGPESAEEVLADVKSLHKMEKVELPWNPRYGGELRGGTHAILVHTRPHKGKKNGRNLSGTNATTSIRSTTAHSKIAHSAQAHGTTSRRLAETMRPRTSTANAQYVYNSSFVDVNAYTETEDTVYLSFFHTRARPATPYYSHINTYFMGAMTHCNRPPFQIHSMSSEPIIFDENQYRVPWFTLAINYVIYPTGIMQSKSNPNNVILSYCTQDRDGNIATLDLHRLLASLTFVANCSAQG